MVDFLSETFTTPQWYQLLIHGNAAILDGTKIRPIVRVMDNVERNHNLAFLYEETVSRGDSKENQILRCTVDPKELLQYPETRHFFEAVVKYLLDKNKT